MEECQPPAAPSPAASRGAETSVPRRNEERLQEAPPLHAGPAPATPLSASCLLWEQLNVTAPEAPWRGLFLVAGQQARRRYFRLREAPGLGLRSGVSSGGPPGHGAHASFGPDVLAGVWCVHTASVTHLSVCPSAAGRGTDGRAPLQGPCPGRQAPGSLHATSMGPVAEAESVRREGRREI